MIHKLLCITIIISSIFIAGCEKNPGETFPNNHRFTIIERLTDGGSCGYNYIAVDNKTGYEYFVTEVRNSYVVGSCVLDENGKPVKYEK
jgi:hypothetical protein